MEVVVDMEAGKNESVSREKSPFGISYGKIMMWYFLLSDSLTFVGFLTAYGFTRFKYANSWPIADEVFNHFPFLHGLNAPMFYVALMTFILIFSSVTMVLAVDAGHHLKKNKVAVYMSLTILGGLIFLGSQAWEWSNFIKGSYGAVETHGGSILQFVGEDDKQIPFSDFALMIDNGRVEDQLNKGVWFSKGPSVPKNTLEGVAKGFESNSNIRIRTQFTDEITKQKTILSREDSAEHLKSAVLVVEGANLIRNEYGHKLFANYFFFITGFHGFHVLIGVVLNLIIFFNVILGTYEKRASYEMVEKVGLYWHFVDLVWVFVFTFFYLV